MPWILIRPFVELRPDMSNHKTRFFVDENLPAPTARCLQNIFRNAEFVASHENASLEGAKDIQLLGALSNQNFDVFITQDLKQMRITGERKALQRSGLSWIGIPHMERRAHGVQLLAFQVSILAPVVGLYLRQPPQQPMAYFLKEATVPEQLILREEII